MKARQDTKRDADVSVMSATPVESSLQADDFTLAELKYVLKVCRRKGVSGNDRILNQALENLTPRQLPLLLDEFSELWSTANTPGFWKSSVILSQLRSGKQFNMTTSFRTFAS